MTCPHRAIDHLTGHCMDCGATSQEIHDSDQIVQLLKENIALRAQLYGQVKDNAEYKELLADRQEQVLRVFRLKGALDKIIAIPNKTDGGDWDEIEEARKIAKEVIEADDKRS